MLLTKAPKLVTESVGNESLVAALASVRMAVTVKSLTMVLRKRSKSMPKEKPKACFD